MRSFLNDLPLMMIIRPFLKEKHSMKWHLKNTISDALPDAIRNGLRVYTVDDVCRAYMALFQFQLVGEREL
jgi:hypothetical protein